MSNQDSSVDTREAIRMLDGKKITSQRRVDQHQRKVLVKVWLNIQNPFMRLTPDNRVAARGGEFDNKTDMEVESKSIGG